MTPASGRQFVLKSGDASGAEVHIASVGATLRRFTVGEAAEAVDLVVPFEADQMRPAYRGATLAPWPNRVVDGRFRFGGDTHQLALTEPARGHALHGLAAWLDFEPVDQQRDRVSLVAVVEPQQGYPWRLRLEVTFALTGDRLTQQVRATNLSSTAAPYGTGPHPYLVAGPGRIDDWTLELPASQVLLTDDRLAPTELAPVAGDGSRFDFRSPRPIGSVEIDHAFTDLARDSEGLAVVRLRTASGSGVAMSWDASCPWVQIHTADLAAGSNVLGHRAGLAVEPMTCGPDAFNQGAAFGLIELQPGSSADASWTIERLPACPSNARRSSPAVAFQGRYARGRRRSVRR